MPFSDINFRVLFLKKMQSRHSVTLTWDSHWEKTGVHQKSHRSGKEMGCCCTLSQRLMLSLFSPFHQKLEWKLDPRHLNLRQGIQVTRAGIINRGFHPQLSLNPRDRRESDSLLYCLVSLFVCFCLKCVVQRKQGWLRNLGLIVEKAFGEVKVGSVHEYRQSQDYCPRPFVFFPSLSLLFCFVLLLCV